MVENKTDSPARRRGPAYDEGVITKARAMRRFGDSYRSIAKALDVPQTTVQYWTQSVVPDKSGRWTLAEAAAATEPDPLIVLAELGAILLGSDGRVAGMTRDEAVWVTLLARIRPDFLTSPGQIWQLARECLEALAVNDEAELQRYEQLLAVGAARLRWPNYEREHLEQRAKTQRLAADLRAGLSPFLDGRPYRPEDKQ